MLGLFASKKAYHADVNSSGKSLEIPAGVTLLNAALDAGIAWPHNCRVGSCGTCRCKLKSGRIKPLNDFSYVLDEDELDDGMILACQTRALSDLEIAVNLDPAAGKISPAATVNGEIIESRSLTHDILEIRVRLDQVLPDYKAGQYAEISIPGIDNPRSYSFSQAPGREKPDNIGFFVRLVPDGEMTTWLHSNSRVGERLSISGPHGTFFLREGESPIVCIAGGSGLAPIKALLEQMVSDGSKRPVRFLFGARTQNDLYCLDDIQEVTRAYRGKLDFIPILSDEPVSSDWQGRRGLVTEFIEDEQSVLSESQAYLCGPPPMIDSAIAVLSAAGLGTSEIFFDKFLDASHAPRN